MIRNALILITGISFLAFPFALSVVLVIALSLLTPLAGVIAGCVYDALYYVPGAGWPVVSIGGVFVSLAAFGIRRFVRNRVSDIAFLS